MRKMLQQQQHHHQRRRRHDLVEIVDGPEAGQRGKILHCDVRYNEIVVENVNVETKETFDTDSSPFNPSFDTVSTPRPIYFRRAQLICPQLDTRTSVPSSVRGP